MTTINEWYIKFLIHEVDQNCIIFCIFNHSYSFISHYFKSEKFSRYYRIKEGNTREIGKIKKHVVLNNMIFDLF
jgi:hypothetical protein